MVDRAYYSARVSEFLEHSDDQIIGSLSRRHSLDLVSEQMGAWVAQCQILRPVLTELANPSDTVFFEFGIPRMGKRADVVLVLSGIVFVIEFKVGATRVLSADIHQAVDYALDLKHFHSGSHSSLVIPVLVATEAVSAGDDPPSLTLDSDGLASAICTNRYELGRTVAHCIEQQFLIQRYELQKVEDGMLWAESGYKPTPTIVQAAQALYEGHDVREISRSDAGAQNLTATATEIGRVIDNSKQRGTKSICFVTGVPGAGKTLAGLNIATTRIDAHKDEHAVFLSG